MVFERGSNSGDREKCIQKYLVIGFMMPDRIFLEIVTIVSMLHCLWTRKEKNNKENSNKVQINATLRYQTSTQELYTPDLLNMR